MISSKPVTRLPVSFVSWFICSLGALFYCYEYFLRIAPSAMENQLRATYHLNASGYGLLASFYYLAYTPMQLVVGLLMDKHGPRRLLFFSCLICALGAYLFTCSDYLAVAELGRFLVGLGSAFAFVGVLKLATIWLPPDRFAMIAGLTTGLGMLGAIIGDNTLTSLIRHAGWRHTLNISAMLGFLLAFAILLMVRDQNDHKTYEERVENHNFRELFTNLLALLRNKQIWITGLIGFCAYTSASAFAELWATPYLQSAHHLSKDAASAGTSLIFFGWMIGSPLIGFLSDHFHNRRTPFIYCGLLTATTMFLLLFFPFMSKDLLYTLLFLTGFFSGAQIIIFAIACEISNVKLAGTAIAFINMFVMINGNLFQWLIGQLLDWHWLLNNHALADRVYSAYDYQFALFLLPCTYLMVFVLAKFFLVDSKARLMVTIQ